MSQSPPSVDVARASPGRLRAYLELLRLPNVFTAVSNSLLGYWFAGPAPGDAPVLAALLASSAALYVAGIVLNDVFDIDIDRHERPHRPLPSGRVSLGAARVLGAQLLLIGAGLGWLVSFLLDDLACGVVATLLAAAIVLYDGWAKSTPLGPLVMGSCRSLNVCLGMAAAGSLWTEAHACVALGLGLYIAGVTWFARREATRSQRWALLGGLLTMAAGLLLMGLFPWAGGSPPLRLAPQAMWWILWAFLMFSNLWRCVPALVDPAPERVQVAIRRCLIALILYDAAIVLALHGGAPAAAVLALLVPTLWLGRWIYST